ncbi:MAG: hypothetical protein D6B27_12395 [Gammaproteobacteria bacterium]|nr:MAG: hypothetical protein D6B27_12395 [Gammaproteobacteria bacterium]
MADSPIPELVFEGRYPDCGKRIVELPDNLPDIGDDFNWQCRDYDSFRLAMMEELIARFPERNRWTPADIEIVLIEALSAILDLQSDKLDRSTVEAFLETARRPDSVRKLLKIIGYDALSLAISNKEPPFENLDEEIDSEQAIAKFDSYWLNNPAEMEKAKRVGVRSIHDQHRMVTLNDYQIRVEEHPLVLRAHSWSEWSGSWVRIKVAVIPWQREKLDNEGVEYNDRIRTEINNFHNSREIFCPDLTVNPTIRAVLMPYVDAYRMVGQEVQLCEADEVGIYMSLTVTVNENYFQSEVQYALHQALGTGRGGFFEPGRLQFGEDLFAGDIFETLMNIDGVDNVYIDKFKRAGTVFRDQSESGRIVLNGLEVAVCDNDSNDPRRGYYSIKLQGGRRG